MIKQIVYIVIFVLLLPFVAVAQEPAQRTKPKTLKELVAEERAAKEAEKAKKAAEKKAEEEEKARKEAEKAERQAGRQEEIEGRSCA